jgi:hypothetical protein
MKKKLGPKKILAIRWPTCGAASGKKCELTAGQPRSEPHRNSSKLSRKHNQKSWEPPAWELVFVDDTPGFLIRY